MVDLMSRCPIQLCNVRISTPCRKCSVAKVWRNLWRKKCRQYGPWAHLFPCLVTHCPQFNSARSATRLTIMSFSLSGFPFVSTPLNQMSEVNGNHGHHAKSPFRRQTQTQSSCPCPVSEL